MCGEAASLRPGTAPEDSTIINMTRRPGPIGILCLLISFLLLRGTARADQHEIRIGILSFLTEEETEQRWAPTARALSEAIDGYAFRFRPDNYPGLNQAVENREVDFVFTNPEHHISLMMAHGLAAFATLKIYSGGLPLDHFGGVIFVRADRADLLELRDIRRKRIAAVSGQLLGGYLAQRGTLMDAGLDIRRDTSSLTFTGMPRQCGVRSARRTCRRRYGAHRGAGKPGRARRDRSGRYPRA